MPPNMAPEAPDCESDAPPASAAEDQLISEGADEVWANILSMAAEMPAASEAW